MIRPIARRGGTPAIIESIRAGLVFQLKEAVGPARIEALESAFLTRAVAAFAAHPALHVLGNPHARRLSIVSFLLRYVDPQAPDREMYLHHNFVVALLNDLFGVQARGGCSCAGPYGHRLLGIDVHRSHAFECAIVAGHEGLKPGWVRVNFNYFISEEAFAHILESVAWVADHGWKLLPAYRFDVATGQWRHRGPPLAPPLSLDDLTYRRGRLAWASRQVHETEEALVAYRAAADAVAAEALRTATTDGYPGLAAETFEATDEALRWFPLPAEVLRRVVALDSTAGAGV